MIGGAASAIDAPREPKARRRESCLRCFNLKFLSGGSGAADETEAGGGVGSIWSGEVPVAQGLQVLRVMVIPHHPLRARVPALGVVGRPGYGFNYSAAS